MDREIWVNEKKEEYNDIPVEFCKTCLSLHILGLKNSAYGYCADCGSTRTGLASIEWIEEEYKRTGKRFITNRKVKI